MKFAATLLLIAGTLCNATLGSAQAPVPFKALMRGAGGQPSATSMQDAAATAPPSHTHMTRGGKIETGIGIGLAGIGVLLIAGGATVKSGDWFAGETRAIGFGGGAAFAGAGTTLIILGKHRRSSK